MHLPAAGPTVLPGQLGGGLCVLRTSSGLGWHYLAGAFVDVIRYLIWWLVGGLVAGGTCWYVGANVYENWVRENADSPSQIGG